MKKIKVLTPLLGLTAIASSLVPLASCSQSTKEADTVPADSFKVVDVTLQGFKKNFDYKNYTKLVIPADVKIIDYNAFSGLLNKDCKITEVVIPGNIETIRKGAFADCNGIQIYDFSQYDVDQIHKLVIEEGAFGDLKTNGIYSFFKMNDNWTEVQKETFKNKLINAGVSTKYFVQPTTGNVKTSEIKKIQYADGGKATNEFTVQGHYSSYLKYEAVITKLESSEGVDIETNPTVTLSKDAKTVEVEAKMIAKDGHKFANNDYVTYKITLICSSQSSSSNEEKIEWVENIDTFHLTYNNILESIELVSGPTKTQYKIGETFDPRGIEIKAHYSNTDEATVKWGDANLTTNLTGHVMEPADITTLKKFKIFYTVDDITKSIEFNGLNVVKSLKGIKVLNPITSWGFDIPFDPTGLKVLPLFDDGSQGDVLTYPAEGLSISPGAGASFNPGTPSVEVKVSYTLGDVTVDAAPFNMYFGVAFENQTWEGVADFANEFEKSDKGYNAMNKLCGHFGDVAYIDNIDPSITDPDKKIEAHLANFIGKTRTVKLNGVDHKVRIVGVNHDTIAGTNKKALFTFEAVNVVCDEKGNALKVAWDINDNTHYYIEGKAALEQSTLWQVLNGTVKKETLPWGRESVYTQLLKYFKSIFVATPVEDTLKQVTKQETLGSAHTVTNYNCYCFPTTMTEMGQESEYSQVEGSAYWFWNSAEGQRSLGKTDVKGNLTPYWLASALNNHTKDVWCVNNMSKITQTYCSENKNTAVSFGFCI